MSHARTANGPRFPLRAVCATKHDRQQAGGGGYLSDKQCHACDLTAQLQVSARTLFFSRYRASSPRRAAPRAPICVVREIWRPFLLSELVECRVPPSPEPLVFSGL